MLCSIMATPMPVRPYTMAGSMLESGRNDKVMKTINPTIPPHRLGWLSFLCIVTAAMVPIVRPRNTVIGAIPNDAPIKVTTPSPPLNLVIGEFQ